ncbi:MAG: site-2 protease family protein, partial [Bacteroidota bacterium]
MDTLITIGQLVLSLSILIVLHEFGHFLPARFFGTRVEKFYLFFDPYFSLFKKQIGETEYGIGWLPLGGYVKISGMIDESFDTEQMESEPQPWEFRSKPAWQRLIIMLGGVTVNFLLGFFIYAMVLFAYGEQYLPAKNATAGMVVDSLGQEMGLQNGDKLLLVGDKPFERFNSRILLREVAINNVREVTVERNGSELVIPIENKWAD